MKKIPSSFELGSFTIRVVRLSNKEMLKKCGDVYGFFDSDLLTIYLCKPSKQVKAQIIYQTFWHEYAHALLWVSDANYNYSEDYIDKVGHLLAQTQLTAR